MVKPLLFYTTGPEETKALAKKLAVHVQEGDVITLEGDLGAGKTTFTKGFAEGLNIKEIVNSPTFTIIKEYQSGRMPLFHMDVYRMGEGEEDLGLEEYFYGFGVCLVEWAHLIADQLPEERIDIVIKRVGDEKREITLKATGERYESIGREINK
ncbi:tRNA (adenosine(37)-N6)-threonylcarbamoyltransferase complex ATPase subunit type 1 TsaE [Bacillus gobiensis]|uniref:tRNA (adenosine(37)-N6)-threonylcarbamoyltransferase complex ATPase subunit type 1 TsaE n=1 Tax=Bacillus gobiensis TaxID=1441095 RepID=UPI003D247D5C